MRICMGLMSSISLFLLKIADSLLVSALRCIILVQLHLGYLHEFAEDEDFCGTDELNLSLLKIADSLLVTLGLPLIQELRMRIFMGLMSSISLFLLEIVDSLLKLLTRFLLHLGYLHELAEDEDFRGTDELNLSLLKIAYSLLVKKNWRLNFEV